MSRAVCERIPHGKANGKFLSLLLLLCFEISHIGEKVFARHILDVLQSPCIIKLSSLLSVTRSGHNVDTRRALAIVSPEFQW